MNLYYIHLGLQYKDYIMTDNELRYEFQQRTNFIDDYFSKAIRKHKFKTDGTFNMIAISATEFELKPTKLVSSDVLEVTLVFDRKRFEDCKETNDCSYYLELLELGFKKASEFKSIPLETLINLTEKFKQGGCRNEWVHKKKRFKEDDIEILLTCEFSARYFQLSLTVNQLSSKTELLRGVVMRTEVGISIHSGMYKDIIVDDKHILITDRSDEIRIEINKQAAKNGRLKYRVLGDDGIIDILSHEL